MMKKSVIFLTLISIFTLSANISAQQPPIPSNVEAETAATLTPRMFLPIIFAGNYTTVATLMSTGRTFSTAYNGTETVDQIQFATTYVQAHNPSNQYEIARTYIETKPFANTVVNPHLTGECFINSNVSNPPNPAKDSPQLEIRYGTWTGSASGYTPSTLWQTPMGTVIVTINTNTACTGGSIDFSLPITVQKGQILKLIIRDNQDHTNYTTTWTNSMYRSIYIQSLSVTEY